MKTLGKIVSIEEVFNYELGNMAPMEGKKGASLGFTGMLSILGGGRSMDGYKVKTTHSEILVLIDNGQSCCENWGYFSTDDDIQQYVGALLRGIALTDTALTTEKIEQIEYLDSGGVQFVTFDTSRGSFQLAVYNAHNGYYGHGIIVAQDGKILCDDTL